MRYAPFMAGASGSGNPFRPGTGRMPPVLAGRDQELALAERRLGELAAGSVPPQGLLLYGPRGTGKTVLLERIARRAKELGLRAQQLAAPTLRSEDSLVADLRERAGLTETRLTGVQLGPIGGTAQPAAPSRSVAHLFAAWVETAHSPLVVVLDEAQAIGPEAGMVFFDAVQAAAMRDLPFLLVAAGTPDAPRRLRQAGSFMERAFENLPLGRLPRTATKQALAEPTVNAGRPLAPDALALLAEESQDYPYFVQLLGSAVWDAAAAARAPEIRAEVARHGLAHARAETSRFYGRRFAEARERGVHRALPALASLMEQPGARLDDAALDAFLDRAVVDGAGSGDPTRLQTTLQDLGILWEASPGRWEMGIPSFAQHVLERSGSRPPR